MKGYMYILRCSNGNYYTGSTKYLELRIAQHQNGEGANYTRKHGPVELVYFEVFDRIIFLQHFVRGRIPDLHVYSVQNPFGLISHKIKQGFQTIGRIVDFVQIIG